MDEIAQLKAAHEAVATAAAAIKARAAALRKQAEELEAHIASTARPNRIRRIISESETASIRQYAADGKTAPEICKLTGLEYWRVKQFIVREGIKCAIARPSRQRSASGG